MKTVCVSSVRTGGGEYVRKSKKAAALGLAVALGCMMPMSTMLAAEDDAENAVSSVSDNDVLYEEERISILSAEEVELSGDKRSGDFTGTECA